MVQPTDPHDPTDFTDDTGIPPDRLDRALAVAFASDPAAFMIHETVNLALEPVTGSSTRIRLRPITGDCPGPSPVDAPASPAGIVGRYQVLGEIARGGLGAVLRVRDENLGRDVALKVLLDQHAGNAAMTRRLLEEAQIGAQLQHPAIVPVYEMGLRPDLRPFFTMKLVQGRTLAALLAQRGDEVGDRMLLLAVFEQICHAMAYAHARGVVHRDLKPSNIMVGTFGEVQVVDWGLAKVLPAHNVELTSSDLAAGATGIAGTPAYMAPEQARGEIAHVDERADVFGLGAILCEILTGNPPFAGSGEAARMLAASGSLDAAFARLAATDAEPELVALTRQCLAPELGERPRNAQLVADAIAAFRASLALRARAAEVVATEARAAAAEEQNRALAAEARADRERYRRQRFAQIAAATAAVLLIAATAGWRIASEHRARVDRTRTAVDGALAQASRSWGAARSGAVERWQEALAAAQQAEALAESGDADAATAVRVTTFLQQLRGDEVAARACRDRADLERATAARLAAIREARGDAWKDDMVPHHEAYQQAFARLGLDVRDGDPAATARAIRATGVADVLIEALDDWARFLRSYQGEGVAGYWQALVQVASAADVDPARQNLRRSWIEGKLDELCALAEAPEVVQRTPAYLDLLGFALGSLGATDAAERLLRRAHVRHPDDFWIVHDLAVCIGQMDTKALAEQLRFFTAALALRPSSYHAWTDYAGALARTRDTTGAIAAYRHALTLNAEFTPAQAGLGDLLLQTDDATGGLACYRECVRQAPGKAMAHEGLARALVATGDLAAARTAAEESVRLEDTSAAAHAALAVVRSRQGDASGAIASLRRAVELDPRNARYWSVLGNELDASGDHQGGLEALTKALAIDPDFGAAYTNRGVVKARLGDLAGAIADYRQALQIEPGEYATSINLGNALRKQGDTEGARAAYRDAQARQPASGEPLLALGNLFFELDQIEAAESALRDAIRVQPDLAPAHALLGHILFQRSDLAAAETSWRTAVKLAPEPSRLASLGIVLRERGHLDESSAVLEQALSRQPGFWEAMVHLGITRRLQGRLDEAGVLLQRALAAKAAPTPLFQLGLVQYAQHDVAAAGASFAAAVQLQPEHQQAHLQIGILAFERGDLDGAVRALRRAVELKPDDVVALGNLASTLYNLSQFDDAIAAAEEVVRLQPGHALAWMVIGAGREQRLDLPGAIAAYRRAVALGHRDAAGPLADCERAVALEQRLPAILRGEDQARNADEQLALMWLCVARKEHGAATEFFAAAVAGGARLDANFVNHPHWTAARAAARAGFGGEHDPELPADDKAATRRGHCLAWLRTELELCRGYLAADDPRHAGHVRQFLASWSEDQDLAGLRDARRVAELPADERQALAALWNEHDRVLAGR